ncbi:MAG: selenocysteine-specific translation elongation factor, partial [Planctomycetaceae bacterium]
MLTREAGDFRSASRRRPRGSKNISRCCWPRPESWPCSGTTLPIASRTASLMPVCFGPTARANQPSTACRNSSTSIGPAPDQPLRRGVAEHSMTSDSTEPRPVRPVILGTAGHIDHGKTSLVRRLTGINTDRLPEEKARGISIDLGFAHFHASEFEFGVVDVPGHERFVRNMVAGATGIDLALLVVAADAGVMPQTIEHLEIMDLLGVATGVVAITKVDLVDPELVELVRLEIADRVAGTFLAGAAVIAVSSTTGAGCAELVEALVATARRASATPPLSLFRLPIDRVFTIAGHGTVVTGTVVSGSVRPGDTLELLPARQSVRVRGVQHHGQTTASGGSSQRCAINLAAVKADEVFRGNELATPEYLRPARRLLVRMRCLSSAPAPLKDRAVYRLHLGTDEVLARVIVKGRPVAPGEVGYAELRLARPVTAAWGQRFILRRASPATTVGGGVILDPGVSPRTRLTDLSLAAEGRQSAEPIDRLDTFLAGLDGVPVSPLEAAWNVGVPVEAYAGLVAQLRDRGSLARLSGGERLVHRGRLDSLAELMLAKMRGEISRR